ncbi:MAG: hypothetical protein JWR70_1609 [Modestobacter sp.]|nr:hypothetical protein [Modestobacter sp.]
MPFGSLRTACAAALRGGACAAQSPVSARIEPRRPARAARATLPVRRGGSLVPVLRTQISPHLWTQIVSRRRFPPSRPRPPGRGRDGRLRSRSGPERVGCMSCPNPLPIPWTPRSAPARVTPAKDQAHPVRPPDRTAPAGDPAAAGAAHRAHGRSGHAVPGGADAGRTGDPPGRHRLGRSDVADRVGRGAARPSLLDSEDATRSRENRSRLRPRRVRRGAPCQGEPAADGAQA